MIRRHKTEDLPEVAVTVTTDSFIRLAALTVALLFIIFAVRKASHAILLIITALVLAIALNGPVYWLSKRLPGKRSRSRMFATVLSFLVVILILGGFFASIVPPLVRQTETLIHNAPKLVQEYRNQNSPIGKVIRHYHLQGQVNTIASQLSVRLKNFGGTAFTTAKDLASSAFSVLTILVLTFMMLIEGPRWVGLFREMVPDHHHRMAERLANDMYRVIKGFVNGQVILAFLAAILITPAVIALKISYPAALMVVIFICGLIPLVGHTIGAVIITLVALFHSTTAAIIILLYYIVYMQIEAYIIQPRIQANATNMSPLLVFSSVIIGVSFGGLFGGLLAIPLAGCLRIALLEYLRSQGILDYKRFKQATTTGTRSGHAPHQTDQSAGPPEGA